MRMSYSLLAAQVLAVLARAAFSDGAVRDRMVEGTGKAASHADPWSLHDGQARRGPLKQSFFPAVCGRGMALDFEFKVPGEALRSCQGAAHPVRMARFADRALCPRQLAPIDQWPRVIPGADDEAGSAILAPFDRRVAGYADLRRLA